LKHIANIKEVSNSTGSEFEQSVDSVGSISDFQQQPKETAAAKWQRKAPARFRDSAFVHDTEAKLETEMRNSKLENFVVTV